MDRPTQPPSDDRPTSDDEDVVEEVAEYFVEEDGEPRPTSESDAPAP